MLITFRSTATESITMFGDVARTLLSMMDCSGRVPGALTGPDVGNALRKLEAALVKLQQQTAEEQHTAAPPAMDEDEDAAEAYDPPIEIAVRAAPLVDLLRRASAAGAEVIWEPKD